MNKSVLTKVAVLVCISVGCGSALKLRAKFAKTHVCPSSSELDQLRPAKLGGGLDLLACFLECAVANDCSVLIRSSSAGCYFGSQQQLQANFSAENSLGSESCESYARVWDEPSDAGGSPAGPLAANLSATVLGKLVILLDFRRGFSNLVNPSKYNAVAHGSVVRDGLGASFPTGSSQDYIEVDTDGATLASTYLAHSKKFTFYARLCRQSTGRQYYHYFYDCASTESRGEFYDDGSRIRVVHAFPGVGSYSDRIVAYKTENSVLSSSSSEQFSSAGSVFDGSSLLNLFSFGAFKSKDGSSASYSGPPLCLRLGYHRDSSYALRGRFVCYAVANDSLSLSELQELETYCAN